MVLHQEPKEDIKKTERERTEVRCLVLCKEGYRAKSTVHREQSMQ